MTKKIIQKENNEQPSTLIERIFPWIQRNATTKVYSDAKRDESRPWQATFKNTNQTTTFQEKGFDYLVIKHGKKDNIDSIGEELAVNNELQDMSKEPTANNNQQDMRKEPTVNNRQQDALFDNPRRLSILEMWNLIESVGIKREMVDKTITTKEAVSELYHIVEKRLHHEREQEWIKELRAHAQKLKNETERIKSNLYVK